MSSMNNVEVRLGGPQIEEMVSRAEGKEPLQYAADLMATAAILLGRAQVSGMDQIQLAFHLVRSYEATVADAMRRAQEREAIRAEIRKELTETVESMDPEAPPEPWDESEEH